MGRCNLQKHATPTNTRTYNGRGRGSVKYNIRSHKDKCRASDTHQVPSEKQDSTETDADKELTEQEIEAFIISEQIAASEGNNADLNSIYTPQLGMEFESKDAAEHFFNFYASLAGFKTVVVHVARTSSLKRDNEMIRTTVKV